MARILYFLEVPKYGISNIWEVKLSVLLGVSFAVILKTVNDYTFYLPSLMFIKPLPLVRGEVGEGFYISQILRRLQYTMI
jgi:hypothetical protein